MRRHKDNGTEPKLTQLQTTQAQILRRSHSPAAAAAAAAAAQQPQSQTLRQAMAVAERDLKHHLATACKGREGPLRTRNGKKSR